LLGLIEEVIVADGAEGRDRDSGLTQQPLHDVLVHADGGSENPGADGGDTGDLEQSLDGTVLAQGTVKYRKHDVDLSDGRRL